MNINDIVLLSGIVLALTCAGFFSGTEMAFVSLKKLLLRKKPARDEHDLRRIQKIMRTPARFISMVLIGTNLALIAASSLTTMFTRDLLPERSAIFIEFLVLAVLTPIIVFFCEVIPKNIGVLYSESVCRRANIPVLFLLALLRPIIAFVGGMSQGLLWLMRNQRRHKKVFVTRQELRAILDESVHKGIFSTREKQLIDTIFDFEHRTVKDKMRAINTVKKIDVNDPLTRVKALASTSTRTRFLVNDKKTGAILGYVNIFDVLFEGHEGGSVKDFLRTPVFLPEMTNLRDAFENLRNRREWILFAVGAQDKVTGILALNDILNF
jgi:putative hemolysin